MATVDGVTASRVRRQACKHFLPKTPSLTQIARLTDTIGKHESGLGDASSRIDELKSRISELEIEARDADARRRTVETSAEALR